MFDPTKFTVAKPKPLPVILLLDTSGSMDEVIDDTGVVDTGQTEFVDGKLYRIVEGGITRIQVLNECCQKMLQSFVNDSTREIDIELAIVTFGKNVEIHTPLSSVSDAAWRDLLCDDGDTPLGAALNLVKGMIEDKSVVPSRAYKPVVILVSDGCPTDSWEQPLKNFIETGRSAKCDRMALGISDKADFRMLSKFVSGTCNPVFEAVDADRIYEFFKYVTMSVTVRTQSKDPNRIPNLDKNIQTGENTQQFLSDEDYF